MNSHNNNQHKQPRVDRARAALWIACAHMLMPVIEFIGKVKPPYSEKKAIEDFYEMVRILKPLDLILSNTRGHLSNILSPGYWKHTIIYIGKENGIPYVAEAIGKGVTIRPLVECISEKDEIAILRYTGEISKTSIARGVNFCKKNENAGYDYSFDIWSSHRFQNFYCSELAYYTLQKAIGKKFKFTLKETFGIPTVTPSDFFNAKKQFKLIMRTRT